MKISSRIDESICGAILSTRWPATSSATVKPAPRLASALPLRAGSFCPAALHRHASGAPRRYLSHKSLCSPVSIPSSSSSPSPSSLKLPPAPQTSSRSSRRSNTTQAVTVPEGDFWNQRRPRPSREELLSLVNLPSDGETVDEHVEFYRDPYLRRYAPADGPEVRVSNSRDDAEVPSWKDVRQGGEREQMILRDLSRAVVARLRNPMKESAENVYDMYRQLPEPRMSYLPASLRHQLLKSLGMVERKDSKSMLRYFAVIADVKNSGYTLWKAEWNAAISFASRYVGSSTDTEAEAALNLWREMEQDAYVKGNEVTFNILFDVASKAGNFTLAEMIYKEMEDRGFRFNRYHHVSLIHFFGLKIDSDGLRLAYREMVDAGEMIDTLVLNCVIAGLLRCGEEDEAARVYERMKNSDEKAANMPTWNYNSQRVVTNVLMMLARVGRSYPEMRGRFQDLVSIRPDLATYRILINHYAVRVGDLATVSRYLNEMSFFGIPLHGAIFLALFKGFATQGGFDGSNWSEQRLQSVWTALIKALDDGADGLYVSKWLVVWALRAFDRCSTPEEVFKVYNSLISRWDPVDEDAEYLISFLHNLLKNKPDHIKLLSRLEQRSHG